MGENTGDVTQLLFESKGTLTPKCWYSLVIIVSGE